MGLLDFLKPVEPIAHPRLGTLRFASGRWRGTVVLPEAKDVALLVPGSRGGPDAAAASAAERFSDWWAAARESVAKGLAVSCSSLSSSSSVSPSPGFWERPGTRVPGTRRHAGCG